MERTRECLAELEARFRQTQRAADVLIVIGRTGSGKSSLVEDLANIEGQTQQSLDAVTDRFEISKAVIQGQTYFVMDTPGFDFGHEQAAFQAIVDGIQAVHPVAHITGILYLTCINQPRFDGLDRLLVRFIGALCGDAYLSRVLLVTTFWTAASAGQQKTFNQQLELLEQQWHPLLGGAGHGHMAAVYSHGRDYSASGVPTGAFIDWFDNRDQIAHLARATVARQYNSRESGAAVVPQIVSELSADTPLHRTSAGQLLGMSPPDTSTGPDVAASANAPSSDSDNSDDAPRGVRQEQRADQPEDNTWSPLDIFVKALLWFFENVKLSVNIGGGFGGDMETRPPGNKRTAYTGPLDPNSSVDIMKSLGMDSSREARLRYASQNGITGTPFTAAWGEAMRRHLRQNNPNCPI